MTRHEIFTALMNMDFASLDGGHMFFHNEFEIRMVADTEQVLITWPAGTYTFAPHSAAHFEQQLVILGYDPAAGSRYGNQL